jgi:hypothetical protein
VLRFLEEHNNMVHFHEIITRFGKYGGDQILKKIIKDISVEVDRNQVCALTETDTEDARRAKLTPEEICQYESALFGEYQLKLRGIDEITNADKISYAVNKFCLEESSAKRQTLAKMIEEEVLCTPWNLSFSFINIKSSGMMLLEGTGDPSNGHGGYSFLKLPLKISQDSLTKAKLTRTKLNPAI